MTWSAGISVNQKGEGNEETEKPKEGNLPALTL